jgi:hypothetical protein
MCFDIRLDGFVQSPLLLASPKHTSTQVIQVCVFPPLCRLLLLLL